LRGVCRKAWGFKSPPEHDHLTDNCRDDSFFAQDDGQPPRCFALPKQVTRRNFS
jgi:hypothetical protein